MSDDRARYTPLYDRHVQGGARMVDFAGWQMPVQYAGLTAEHGAVRERAGLFDVSHMGEIRVRGSGAQDFLQRLTPNDVVRLTQGRAHYSALLTERGTYLDDLLVYRLGEEEFLLVVNAANTASDLEWIVSRLPDGVEVEDASSDFALLALQGPKSEDILQPLTDVELSSLKYYRFAQGKVAGLPAIVSRTGYTGEDGFELYLAAEASPELWDRLLEAGESLGLVPAGLGARNTLRLEAGLALYGHEIDDTTTPFEAGLEWTVKLGKGDFVGREALKRQKESGPERRLVGLALTGRGIAREGHPVLVQGQKVGSVTSGTWSPTLEKALGMAYVPRQLAEPGTPLSVEVRGRLVDGVIVELPFYQRANSPG
ncbi:MAG: glycine cleavage system aminomethyltransferase GcvT [Longimicrobiales bacterium]